MIKKDCKKFNFTFLHFLLHLVYLITYCAGKIHATPHDLFFLSLVEFSTIKLQALTVALQTEALGSGALRTESLCYGILTNWILSMSCEVHCLTKIRGRDYVLQHCADMP